MVPNSRVAIRMTSAFSPLSHHNGTQVCRAYSGSPINEEHAWCPGRDRPLFLHSRVSRRLDLVGFIVTEKRGPGTLCGPQPPIPGVQYKGRDVLVQRL